MDNCDCCCFYTVTTSEVAVKERCGKNEGVLEPGLNYINCCTEYVIGRVSFRMQYLEVKCESKTRDNVFVDLVVSVQYQVLEDGVYDAFYSLTNQDEQIRAYVFDVIRSSLPQMTLDQAFESKADLALSVKSSLSSVMQKYGYRIIDTLVTDLAPNKRVRDAMNRINESRSLKEACKEKGEADKILKVKSAEAQAEARYLSGQGVARQRKAVVDGLRDSIISFADNIEESRPRDVMDLLLLTEYFDTLRTIGSNPGPTQIFLPYEKKGVQSQLRNGLLHARAASLKSRMQMAR